MSAIDRSLADEPGIEPSSRFAREVMRAVLKEQSVPLPLPFPWGRLTTGIAACAMLGGLGSLSAGTPDLAVGRAIAESLSVAALPLGYAAVTLCIVYCGLCLHRTLVSEI